MAEDLQLKTQMVVLEQKRQMIEETNIRLKKEEEQRLLKEGLNRLNTRMTKIVSK